MTSGSFPISLWDVVFLENFKLLTEPNHNKWLVVTRVDGNNLSGFVITSERSAYVLARPHLYPCYTPIDEASHLFLRYDSFVDCSNHFPVTPHDYDSIRHSGRVTRQVAQAIVQAAQDCPKILRRTKEYMAGLPLPEEDSV